MAAERLLDPDEPRPVTFENEAGISVFFLTCDHAGRAIPRRLGSLGLPEDRDSIATSPGTSASALSDGSCARLLDAAVILQTYSRLVVDCNRDPDVPSSIPEISETTEIPGNRGLDEAERKVRVETIFRPYHETIAAALDRRAAAGRASVLVALHSFTPVFKGEPRPWHAAVLYQSRCASRACALGDFAARPRGSRRRRQRALPGQRLDRLHRPGARRAARPAACRDRDPPGSDRRAGGPRAWAERLARLLPAAYAEFLRR